MHVAEQRTMEETLATRERRAQDREQMSALDSRLYTAHAAAGDLQATLDGLTRLLQRGDLV